MDSLHRLADRALALWHERGIAVKSASFAAVGVVNAMVDYGVFFLARALLNTSAAVLELAGSLAAWCNCLSTQGWILIPANLIAWIVAVSGSYVMNSFITFARESGRQLRWRDYRTFVASGVAGVIANTTTLVVASHWMPIWAAKLAAIAVGFVLNFSLSHFVVFRKR